MLLVVLLMMPAVPATGRRALADATGSRLGRGLGDVGDLDVDASPATATTTTGFGQHVQRIEPGVADPARATADRGDIDATGRVASPTSPASARHLSP